MGPFYQVILWNALFSPQSLKVPKEECNKFTLFTTILFDNMWRIQNQTTFVCHILVPKKATEKDKQSLFWSHCCIVCFKVPVATKWLPPPPNWVKINFDVAIPHSSTIVVVYRNEVREDHFACSSLLPPSNRVFGWRLKIKIISLFNLFLLLFMGSIALFGTIYKPHYTISTNFYFYLQYFQ